MQANTQHQCHGNSSNTYSFLLGTDPDQNLIKEKIDHSEAIKEFRVHCPAIARSCKPGQFIIIRGSENGERVPLTIADYQGDDIIIVIQVVGHASKKLADFNVGDKYLDIVGPLGHASEIKNFGTIVCVGGGLGIAPTYPIQKALKDAGNKVISIIGSRNSELLFWQERMKDAADELYVLTDDGSSGQKGFVTNKLQELINQGVQIDRTIAIGPPIMMKAVSDLTKQAKIPTITSLNAIMIDGTGMCGCCRVEVAGETKFTCVDGPEFDAHLVNFDLLLSRLKANTEQAEMSFREDEKVIQSQKVDIPLDIDIGEPGKRMPMPEQPASERKSNFLEVALGYTPEMAKTEAARCLQCKKAPCVSGCPVNVNIPGFINEIKEGNFLDAAKILKTTNNLASVCGRVCPQETQCEAKCVLNRKGESVAIGRLERFAADFEAASGTTAIPSLPKSTGKMVAIIGSGPAGLTAASDLALAGHKVTVFEALHAPGGVLAYGIPEFRLPKAIVQKECEYLSKLGVEFKVNLPIGPVLSIPELMSMGFSAAFIGTGAGLPWFLGIPGENLKGVYSSNEILTRINLMKAYRYPFYDTSVMVGKNVCVIGGGNVAMDAARSMLRLGAESVRIVYRRSTAELPARLEEVHHAIEEGVEILELTLPLQAIGDSKDWVQNLECLKMELGEPDSSGRRRPVEIPGSEHLVPCDQLILAIGNGPNPVLTKTFPDLTLDKRGNIPVDDNMMTNIPGIFAGGDIVTGAATVIEAMGAGKKAAAAITNYLSDK